VQVRRLPPVQKSGSSEEQKKRTIHLLQNRTFLFALDRNNESAKCCLPFEMLDIRQNHRMLDFRKKESFRKYTKTG
jgi:hypothetical protein